MIVELSREEIVERLARMAIAHAKRRCCDDPIPILSLADLLTDDDPLFSERPGGAQLAAELKQAKLDLEDRGKLITAWKHHHETKHADCSLT